MKKILVSLLGVTFFVTANAADKRAIEMDESDLAKKAAAEAAVSRDEQPLRVQEHMLPPMRTLNLRAVQNQVLNLNVSDKDLEESDVPTEE